MAANEEKDIQEAVDANDQKSNNLVAENSLSVNEQEPFQDKDETKTDKQECDGKNSTNVNSDEKKKEKPSDINLVVRLTGFTRLNNETEQLKLYYTFFTEEIGISAPLVEMSAMSLDDSVIFQLKSKDDKKILFSKIRRRKIYKWRNYRLEVKEVPKISLVKEFEKLPLEEALQLLYPYKEIPYGKQLQKKTEVSQKVIDSILPKKQANRNIKTIVPSTCVEGYDYNVPLYIEEDIETKSSICGIRVMSADKKKRACIVPIEMCLNVPNQIALVAKDFVDHMSEFSFTPFNKKTSEGNILGIALQMTLSGNFIITLIVPTTNLEQFKQLTPNGVDGDVITVQNFSKTDDTQESMIEKAEKYFNMRGKDHGILSVYMTIINPQLGLSWCGDNTLPDAHHILGDSSIQNNYHGQEVQVMWTKDYPINNSVIPILNIIQEWGYINDSSSIYLMCNHKIVALYLANRVENLSMLCSGRRGNLITMKAWAKKMGLSNIEFIDLLGGDLYHSARIPTAIIWHTMKKPIIDSLLACGISNITFVSYWVKDPSYDFIKSSKEVLKYALKKFEISNIIPIDIAPYTDRFCLLIFLQTKKYLLTRKRSCDSLERLQQYYYPYEAEQNRRKRLKATHF